MSLVDICDFEHDFAAYMKRVEDGETFIVTRNRKPVAQLGQITLPEGQSRPVGLYAGQFVVPDDFNDPLPEDMLLLYEGG